MAVPTTTTGGRLILSPREDLKAGGPAEDFEGRVQDVFKRGYRHLVVDLHGVPTIYSAGVRALVRGLTTSQRLGGSFTLAAPKTAVLNVLAALRLDTVFPIHAGLESAVARRVPWRALRLSGAAVLVVGGLLALDYGTRNGARPLLESPALLGFLKLAAAGAIGLLVSAVHNVFRHDRAITPSMEQAQVLLAVSGAMMMVIIEGDLARAFGIAGAAAIIRFRTPVEDPKDITILFLLMGLGMSSGLGLFGVAGTGTLFLCLLLWLLDRTGRALTRSMMVEIEAAGREFPTAHVQSVFARNRVLFELREIAQSKDVAVRYHATIGQQLSLDEVTEQLVAGGTAGVKSVCWELPKKND